jgi:hypothetical protein
MTFRSLRPQTQNHNQAFATAEALVTAGVSAVVLTGSIVIVNQQIKFAMNGRAMGEVQKVINQDIKSIRQYASLWSMQNNVFDRATANDVQEFPDAMTYVSSPACRSFTRRGSLETFARSDMQPQYNTAWFPYISQIWQNNGVVSSIPVTGSVAYQVRRRYTVPSTTSSTQLGTSSALRADEIPYTLRVTYTLKSVETNSNGIETQSDMPLEQTADINFVAQYSC